MNNASNGVRAIWQKQNFERAIHVPEIYSDIANSLALFFF